jgi:hypothetical protein
MKKNIFFSLFLILAVLGGLMLSSCDGEKLEDGVGTIKLINNSNVRISYWSLEKGGKTVWETHSSINSGSSASYETDTGSYTIYLEDTDGDGWITKTTHTVKKDEIVEVKFSADFKVSN